MDSETVKPDKFQAVWVSHSSISDFLHCPRAYFLKNVYKDPRTGRKMTIMSPALSLGQAVHEVIESLSSLPREERLTVPLDKKLTAIWEKISGEKGGFDSREQEAEYKQRGLAMLKAIEQNPGPILNKAVKIKADGGLPYFWLSEKENIILCGKVDWLEYLPQDDALHIIDFKTGKNEEHSNSLQLPIYFLLVSQTQKRPVKKASYWYLASQNNLSEQVLPDQEESHDKILKAAKRIKLARLINHFKCPQNGCRHCLPFERVLKGNAKLVGVGQYNQDLYVLE